MTNKYHVFFRRVSTANQSIDLQSSADALFREKLLPEEIKIINEDAVSANKKSIDEREGMQKVIGLIKKNQVDTLYAFDRTRLFREFYEGSEFDDLRKKHHVKIIYTSGNPACLPSSDDTLLEGMLNLFCDIEGKSIASRSAEASKRYPNNKTGFVKTGKPTTFKKDPEKKDSLKEFFDTLPNVSSIEELGELLKQTCKKLKCQPNQLIKIAQDPFYAGYDLSKGENRLSHVEPYLDLKTFRRIGETVGNLLHEYSERIKAGVLLRQNKDLPICGVCHKPLNPRFDIYQNAGMYTCSRKHAKVFISIDDLQQAKQLVLSEVIEHIDSDKLVKQSIEQFRSMRKHIETELKAINHQMNEIQMRLLFESEGYSPDWKESHEFKKKLQLEKEHRILLEELAEKERLLTRNKSIAEQIKEHLMKTTESNLSLLSTMLLGQTFVHHNEVEIEVSHFDYLKEVKTELIYTGDEVI